MINNVFNKNIITENIRIPLLGFTTKGYTVSKNIMKIKFDENFNAG